MSADLKRVFLNKANYRSDGFPPRNKTLGTKNHQIKIRIIESVNAYRNLSNLIVASLFVADPLPGVTTVVAPSVCLLLIAAVCLCLGLMC